MCFICLELEVFVYLFIYLFVCIIFYRWLVYNVLDNTVAFFNKDY